MNALPADIPYDRLLSPAVLLFGDDPGRRAMLAERVAEHGARVVASEPLGDALPRSDRSRRPGFCSTSRRMAAPCSTSCSPASMRWARRRGGSSRS